MEVAVGDEGGAEVEAGGEAEEDDPPGFDVAVVVVLSQLQSQPAGSLTFDRTRTPSRHKSLTPAWTFPRRNKAHVNREIVKAESSD